MHVTNWKPKPRLLERRARRAAVTAEDRKQNDLVKIRSGGACEVRTVVTHHSHVTSIRCLRRAVHVHHLISGMGRRNIGKSILAAHKLHVCDLDHADIHGHVLVPVDFLTREDAATVVYSRVT